MQLYQSLINITYTFLNYFHFIFDKYFEIFLQSFTANGIISLPLYPFLVSPQRQEGKKPDNKNGWEGDYDVIGFSCIVHISFEPKFPDDNKNAKFQRDKYGKKLVNM